MQRQRKSPPDGAGKRERLASLDLLRLAAALAVVMFHYLFRGAEAERFLAHGYPAAAPFAIYGYLGVNLFFLISGFVIAWSAEGRAWTEFAAARFARLYPGFLVCMTATFIVQSLAADPRFPTGLGAWLANLLMFAPTLKQPFMDGVYWSIVLEIVFYGWVAIALFFGVFSRWKLPLVAGWLLIAALNETLFRNAAVRLVFITEYAPYFASGIVAHHIASKGRSAEAAALLAAAFLLSCQTLTVTEGWMQAHYGVSAPLPMLVAANAAIYALFAGAILLRRAVAPSRLALVLGGLTYPLYLLHQDIGYIVLNAAEPHVGRWAAFGLVAAAMFTASFLVWRFVETPVRKPLIALILPLLNRAAGRPPIARPSGARS